jgi:hypothetical protein
VDVGGRTDLARDPGMSVAVPYERSDGPEASSFSSVTSAAAAVRSAGAATVKTAAAASLATVKTTADASLAAGRIGARHAAMIEAAEGAGMIAGRCPANTFRFAARESAGMTEGGMVDAPRSAIELIVIAEGPVAIDESRAAGDVGAVVV